MKIIERNGKYYQQFLDGEIEITVEEMKERKESLDGMSNYLEKG